jgi:hypothetical protein
MNYSAFYLLKHNAASSVKKSTDVSEEHVASIFRIDEQAKKEIGVKRVANTAFSLLEISVVANNGFTCHNMKEESNLKISAASFHLAQAFWKILRSYLCYLCG